MGKMTYDALEALGRERLSDSFYMREFLYSEIANWHQLRNVPDFPEQAVRTGRHLCMELLEPLQQRFGRIHVRSGYRSPEVNDFGNRNNLNCASNEKNYAEHIWDHPDLTGHYGATACVVVPKLADYISRGGSWTAMAWWIHDHLPYSSLCFFSKLGAFNIGWHEVPKRRIDSFASPKGCLTKPGMPNHLGSHAHEYADLLLFADSGSGSNSPTPEPHRVVELEPQFPPLPLPVQDHGSNSPARVGRINYRAVHTKSGWRKAGGHGSMDSAIYGKSGAAGLFAGTVRIDYERHGAPLYVLVWRDGEPTGKVIRPHLDSRSGIELADIPAAAILSIDAHGNPVLGELASFFR
jgi:hypothetical protein